MRFLSLALVCASLFAGTVSAAPVDIKDGVDFQTLAAPQPVQAAEKKVEVIEFFMYHCHFCNALEPQLAAWVKQQGERIVFKRIHFPYSGANDPEAHLYLTLEAMGQVDAMHAKVFHAVHDEHIRLNTDEKIADWVGKNGIDRVKYLEVFNSFFVQSKLRRLSQSVANYKVDSAPTLVVDGRYLTSPSIVGASRRELGEEALHKQTIDVLDALVTRAQKENAAKPAVSAAK